MESNGVSCGNCANTQGIIFCDNSKIYCPVCNTYSVIKTDKPKIQEDPHVKVSDTSTNNVKTPARGKPRVGKVIAIIVCIVFFIQILPFAISQISIAIEEYESKHATTETSEARAVDGPNGGRTGTMATPTPIPTPTPTIAYETDLPSRIYLTDLDSYTGDDFRRIRVGDTDIFGNTYHCGFRGYTREDSASWRLNGAYSMFSFTFGVHSKNKGYYGSGSISIYKDGELIWECLDITSIHESETVNLDITGAKDLTVTIRSSGDVFPMEPSIFDPVLCR